jgi:uncharacterized membrane protein
MSDYIVVKWLHVLSSTLLFGTGLGSAFYAFFVSRSGDARATAVVLKWVVIADWLFTATTVVLQPATGVYLWWRAGFPIDSRWLVWSLVLFLVAGACWLPVVWLQLRMRDLAKAAAADGSPLPERFRFYLRIWTTLGVPAFAALVVVFYLMVAKPT